jgi:flagellar biosynthesis protein FlhA
VLVTTMYVRTPLEFAVFPSLLLAVTLFRLVLNVATTRLILTAESDLVVATTAAGEVVLAFSNFVTGEKIAVGAVIFLIIFLIQFIVITKGCSRISEVHARFVLDAMPGKQMAIDSDLSAGVIKEPEAAQRREEVHQQADFYGAMDGASKFVRGDAIAGVLITAVNIVGGLCIGVLPEGLVHDATHALHRPHHRRRPGHPGPRLHRLHGRGPHRHPLQQQDRARRAGHRPDDRQAKALVVAAAFLVMLAFTGLPRSAAGHGSACAALAYLVHRRAQPKLFSPLRYSGEGAFSLPSGRGRVRAHQQDPVEKLLDLESLELEIAPGLLKLADTTRGGDLMDRIRRPPPRLSPSSSA